MSLHHPCAAFQGEHRQACATPAGAREGVPGLYPDGIPWRHLSALSPACVHAAARVCFVDKLRPIINRYKMEAVHNIGILFRSFRVPHSPVPQHFIPGAGAYFQHSTVENSGIPDQSLLHSCQKTKKKHPKNGCFLAWLPKLDSNQRPCD